MKKKVKQPGKLNRTDLAHMLNELFEVPYDQFYRRPVFGLKVLDAILKAVEKGLRSGEDVYIRGFGTFKHYTTPKRKMPSITVWSDGNPKHAVHHTEPIEVGGKHTIIFEPSIQLMAMLNKHTPNFKEDRAKSIWNK